MINLDTLIKKQRHYFANKGPSSQGYDFSSVMYGCKSWTIKKAEYWSIDAFELWCWRRLLRVPWLQGKQPINPRGNQSWIFIGRTDAEAEAPILWLPDAKNWLIGKDPDAGKDWRQKEKGTTEDKMVGWHYWSDGHEFEQAPGVGDGQGSLVCYSPWGHEESDMTVWLKWNEFIIDLFRKYGVWNIVTYKKYIFGHSDDQNIFPIYFWSLSMVPGSQFPRPLKSPKW